MGFPEIGVPQYRSCKRENPIHNGWFRGTPISGNHHISINHDFFFVRDRPAKHLPALFRPGCQEDVELLQIFVFLRPWAEHVHLEAAATVWEFPPEMTIQTSPKWWCLWILKVSFEGWWTFHPTKWRKWAIFFGSLWKFEIAMTPPFLL